MKGNNVTSQCEGIYDDKGMYLLCLNILSTFVCLFIWRWEKELKEDDFGVHLSVANLA